MFDRIIKIGSMFDWISPLITLMQDYRYRPSVGYAIPVDDSWTAFAIADLLEDHGIKVWGLRIFQNTIMLRVRVVQAAYTQYLLEQNGITYHGGIDVHAEIASIEPQKFSPKRKRASGMLNEATSSINRFVDKLSNA